MLEINFKKTLPFRVDKDKYGYIFRLYIKINLQDIAYELGLGKIKGKPAEI